MAPPSATSPTREPQVKAPLEPGLDSQKARAQAMKFPEPPKFESKKEEQTYQKGRLALAFRLFAKYGFDEGVAGHITYRDPLEPTSFWVNPFGVPWDTMRASDLIRVDANGDVVEGGEVKLLNKAAYMIHHAVHEARPDVDAVAHSHSIYGRAFCTLGRNIDIITQDSCAFYNDIALYNSFKGVVLVADEGLAIAKALGNKKAALLQNHGLLTCGKTIEETVFWFTSLEKSCQAQLLADAAAGGRGGETVKIDDEDAAFTYKTVGSPTAGWFSAKPAFENMIRIGGESYKD